MAEAYLTAKELERIGDVYYSCGGMTKGGVREAFRRLMIDELEDEVIEKEFAMGGGSKFLGVDGLVRLVGEAKRRYCAVEGRREGMEAKDAFAAVAEEGVVSKEELSELLKNTFSVDFQGSGICSGSTLTYLSFKEALQPSYAPSTLAHFRPLGAVEDPTGNLVVPLPPLIADPPLPLLTRLNLDPPLFASHVSSLIQAGQPVMYLDDFEECLTKCKKRIAKGKLIRAIFAEHLPTNPLNPAHRKIGSRGNSYVRNAFRRFTSVRLLRDAASERARTNTTFSIESVVSERVGLGVSVEGFPEELLPTKAKRHRKRGTRQVSAKTVRGPQKKPPKKVISSYTPETRQVFTPTPELYNLRHSTPVPTRLTPIPPATPPIDIPYIRPNSVPLPPPPRDVGAPYRCMTPNPRSYRNFRRELRHGTPWVAGMADLAHEEHEWVQKEYQAAHVALQPSRRPMNEGCRAYSELEVLPDPPPPALAALLIQKMVRGMLARKLVTSMRDPYINTAMVLAGIRAVVLVTAVQGLKHVQHRVKTWFLRRVMSSMTIQKHQRVVFAKAILSIKQANLQRYLESEDIKAKLAFDFTSFWRQHDMMHNAVTGMRMRRICRIQAWLRGCLTRKRILATQQMLLHIRLKENQVEDSLVMLQKMARRHNARLSVRRQRGVCRVVAIAAGVVATVYARCRMQTVRRDAAGTVQRFLRVLVATRKARRARGTVNCYKGYVMAEENRVDWAAVTVQRLGRGWYGRRARAAVVVQCAVRCWGARRALREMRAVAVGVWVRGLRDGSARVIQVIVRGWLGRRRAAAMKETVRRYIEHRVMQEQQTFCLVIQSWWRRVVRKLRLLEYFIREELLDEDAQEVHKVNESAATIQRAYRSYTSRTLLGGKKAAVREYLNTLFDVGIRDWVRDLQAAGVDVNGSALRIQSMRYIPSARVLLKARRAEAKAVLSQYVKEDKGAVAIQSFARMVLAKAEIASRKECVRLVVAALDA